MVPIDAPLVWIIDDDEGILEVTQVVLEEEGFRTMVIQNERELAEKLSGNLPAIILLDVLMSGIDGRDIAIQFKKNSNTKNIPIIMMSADTHIEEKVKEAQADDYIKKPFDIDKLTMKVKEWLGKETS